MRCEQSMTSDVDIKLQKIVIKDEKNNIVNVIDDKRGEKNND